MLYALLWEVHAHARVMYVCAQRRSVALLCQREILVRAMTEGHFHSYTD